MRTVRRVVAMSVVTMSLAAAFAAAYPALSETKRITAPPARPPAKPVTPVQVEIPAPIPEEHAPAPAPVPQPAAKAFPVTVPEAKEAAAAAAKPPEAWPDTEIAIAKARCTAILKRIHAVAIPVPAIKQGICGTPAPIQLISIGRSPEVALSPPVTVTCELAEALYNWMKADVQPLAKQRLGAEVIKIETMSSYSCRNAYGRKGGRLSEHGVANAIDIRGFVTSAGRHAYVLDHWGTTQREILARIAAEKAKAAKIEAEKIAAARVAAGESADASSASPPPATAAAEAPAPPAVALQPAVNGDENHAGESDDGPSFSLRVTPSRLGGPKPETGKLSDEARRRLFLRDVHAAACRTFGTTLGPEANHAHKNHFHIDLASRKNALKICD